MADQTVQSKVSAVGGGEIHLGITRKPITAWGGMAVFAAFCESVGLRGVLDGALGCLDRVSPNALPASDHFLAFMVGVLPGASRFLHLERLRADSPLREMFGIQRFCAPSTCTRFFRAFSRQAREAVFTSLTRWSLGLLPGREGGYTLDLDSTVLERFGEREGVLPGYNPRRHGRPTHHPPLAGLAEAKWVLHGWLRGGNTATANNVRGFMDECLAYRTYNGRGDFENRIKGLKQGCGLEGFCLDSFDATDAWMTRFNAALTRILGSPPNCKATSWEGPLMTLMA